MKNYLKIILNFVAVFLLSGALHVFAAPSYVYEPSVLPQANDTYSLGSTSPNLEWKGVYTKDLNVTGLCTGCGAGGVGTSTNPFMASYFVATSSTATSTFAGHVKIRDLFVTGDQSNYAVHPSQVILQTDPSNTTHAVIGGGDTFDNTSYCIEGCLSFATGNDAVMQLRGGDNNNVEVSSESTLSMFSEGGGGKAAGITVSPNNNIGIGTTTPGAKLVVFASSTDSTTYSAFSTFQTTAARSDATLALGYTFTPTVDVTVSQLGRLYAGTGTTQNHVVYIYNNTTQALVTSGTVLAASASDSTNYKYVSITPVKLLAGTVYSIVSAETSGGDTWPDIWDSTNYFGQYIKRTGFAYGTAGSWPNSQSAGVSIYNAPNMKFTVEQYPQQQIVHDSGNALSLFMRSNGNASFVNSNSDKFIGFSGLAVGKTQGTAGQALDVAGAVTINAAYPALTITDGSQAFSMGVVTGGTGTANGMRWGSNFTEISTRGTLYLNLDSGSVVDITGTLRNGLGSSGSPGYTFSADNNTGWWGTGSDVLAASTAGSERLRIDANGLVGIGTSTPDSALDVNGAVRFEGASSFVTASISGAIVGIGCDTADTTGLTGLASTTAFVTTPQSAVGAGVFFYTQALTSTSARTFVCSDVTVTPNASTYNVKIIR